MNCYLSHVALKDRVHRDGGAGTPVGVLKRSGRKNEVRGDMARVR